MKASASLIVEESRDMQVSTSFACGEAVKKQDCDVSEKTDHTPINKAAKKGFFARLFEK